MHPRHKSDPPIAIELADAPAPFQAAERLASLSHMLLLESSMRHSHLGRYSFLMADPVEWFQPAENRLSETFEWLNRWLATHHCSSIPDLPPFQGGIAGLFGYEFNSAIEKIQRPGADVGTTVGLGVYDVVIAWDHEQDRAWIISHGLAEFDSRKCPERAMARANRFLELLNESLPVPRSAPTSSYQAGGFHCPDVPHLTSNMDRDTYIDTIERALEYIRAGDIFQVNIAQQLSWPATAHPLDLYGRLRECNPSTFAVFLDMGDRQVVSASPERLVSVRDGQVETRPIKGTRRRTKHPEVDIDVAQQLLSSEKDRAENVMIVDLMRNDLSRVCRDNSVRVSQFVELESYASVLHLVSAVKGELRDDVSASELLRAVFPGGSVTGAPKVRAMEIIAELELSTRGPYCGSIGYFGLNGFTDLNILIRTITAEHGIWKFPVGGGIVAHSDPEREYEETWTKAHGMLTAVTSFAPEHSRGAP